MFRFAFVAVVLVCVAAGVVRANNCPTALSKSTNLPGTTILLQYEVINATNPVMCAKLVLTGAGADAWMATGPGTVMVGSSPVMIRNTAGVPSGALPKVISAKSFEGVTAGAYTVSPVSASSFVGNVLTGYWARSAEITFSSSSNFVIAYNPAVDFSANGMHTKFGSVTLDLTPPSTATTTGDSTTSGNSTTTSGANSTSSSPAGSSASCVGPAATLIAAALIQFIW